MTTKEKLWEIRGVSLRGRPVTIRVRADDLFEAQRIAKRKGIKIVDTLLIESEATK